MTETATRRRRRRALGVLVALGLLAAGLWTAGRLPYSGEHYGIWSLAPPAVALVLAFTLRDVVAALFIGIMDNMAIIYDISFYPLFAAFGVERDVGGALRDIVHLTTAGIAPVLPYLLLVLVLIARPRGLFGVRDV